MAAVFLVFVVLVVIDAVLVVAISAFVPSVPRRILSIVCLLDPYRSSYDLL